MRNHRPLHAAGDDPCWKPGQVHVLRNRWLAAWETTDVVLLDWSQVARCDDALLASLGEGLRLAGTRMLELDSRDLGMLLVTVPGGRAPMVHDAVPGGAGHVLELLERGREWLEDAYALLYRDEEHHLRCETACFDCILSYGIQEQFGQQLRRQAACDLLKGVLEGLAPSLAV